MADLVEAEAAQAVVVDPARKRFRGLAEEVRGGAAQHQEPRPPRAAVRQHAKDGKEVGPALHLVDDDQTAQVAEHELRVFVQAVQVGGALQVEPMGRAPVLPPDLARQGRLADLPRTQDGDHGKAPQPPQEGGDMLFPGDHGPGPYHENSADTTEFS